LWSAEEGVEAREDEEVRDEAVELNEEDEVVLEAPMEAEFVLDVNDLVREGPEQVCRRGRGRGRSAVLLEGEEEKDEILVGRD